MLVIYKILIFNQRFLEKSESYVGTNSSLLRCQEEEDEKEHGNGVGV